MFSEAILLCKLILGACVVSASIKAYYEKNNKLATSKYGSKRDLKRLLGNDGIILSKNYQLNFDNTLEHTLVLGPTGSKKTTSIFLPNLLDNKLPLSSIVISDPKGELYKLSSKYQQSIGRTPILFEPLGNASKYNILTECKDELEVKELAQSILTNGDLTFRIDTNRGSGGSEWLTMAQPLLTAVLLYSRQMKGTIKEAVDLILDHDEASLGNILLSQNKSIQKQYKLFMMALESPKTMSSIKVTLASAVQLFLDETLYNNTFKTEFTANDLRNKPIALYLSYPERKSMYLAPYLACFYTQFINHLMDIQGLPIVFLFDEFANIGHLNNYPTTISTARSRGIAFVDCLQSLTQLYQLYGRDNAMNILNNLKTKVVLPGLSDIEALKYVSSLCGNKEIMVNNSKTKKNLLDLDEVRRIEDDKAVIISQNKLPIIDDLNLYFKNEEYVKRSKM